MTDKTKAPEPGSFCSTCGAFCHTQPTPEPKDAAPGQLRQFEIPAQSAAEAEIQKKLHQMQAEIERDFGARLMAGAFDKENLPNAKREPTVGELAESFDQLEERYDAMQRTSARELSEQVARNVGFDRRIAAFEAEPNPLFRLAAFHTRLERIEEDQKHAAKRLERVDYWDKGLNGFTSEINQIGTRQFDTGRRLEIVSESCAAAHKAARQARWGAFLLAVVVFGLLCGLVIGKVA